MIPLRFFSTTLAVLSLTMLPLAARAQEEGQRISPDAPLVAAPPISSTDGPTGGMVELHRLRIVNQRDGAIQVSTDRGETWRLIGRVLAPATTTTEGYAAAQYATPGTVAAIAVHGIRIRTGDDDPTLHDPLVLSLDPVEYARGTVNKGYGGHVAGSAGIQTDVPAGTSIFRDLSPLVGNAVFQETTGGRLIPVSPAFRPTGTGETFVIPVQAPKNSLTEVVFENRAGGKVTVTFADGSSRQVTHVVKPVIGVGRFDGTAYTGVGRVNTNHTGVITVSTAPVDGARPEGEGRERRGGFQISPSWHNSRLEEAGAPVIMTVGDPDAPRKRGLEGTAPLFKSLIGLGEQNAANAGDNAVFEAAIDNGPWEPMPTILGSKPAGFTGAGLTANWKAQGISRISSKGVTAFRLRLPLRSPVQSQKEARAVVDAYRGARLAAARAGKIPIVNGILSISAAPSNTRNVTYVRLSIEGTPHGFTNVAPFNLSWDTTRVLDGEYLIEASAMDAGGIVLATTHKRVYVLNHASPAQKAAQADF